MKRMCGDRIDLFCVFVGLAATTDLEASQVKKGTSIQVRYLGTYKHLFMKLNETNVRWSSTLVPWPRGRASCAERVTWAAATAGSWGGWALPLAGTSAASAAVLRCAPALYAWVPQRWWSAGRDQPLMRRRWWLSNPRATNRPGARSEVVKSQAGRTSVS